MQEGRALVGGLIKIEEHLLFKRHHNWDAQGCSSADVREYVSESHVSYVQIITWTDNVFT